MEIMKISVIKVGNSKGIIIPSQYLKNLGNPGEVEIEPLEDGLHIKPAEDNTRKDWDKKFAEAINKEQEPEEDHFEGINNDYDEEEWTW